MVVAFMYDGIQLYVHLYMHVYQKLMDQLQVNNMDGSYDRENIIYI
jgi:hypothetical protein